MARYMTLAEVAAQLNISRQFAFKLVKKGVLTGELTGRGVLWLVDSTSVGRYIAGRNRVRRRNFRRQPRTKIEDVRYEVSQIRHGRIDKPSILL